MLISRRLKSKAVFRDLTAFQVIVSFLIIGLMVSFDLIASQHGVASWIRNVIYADLVFSLYLLHRNVLISDFRKSFGPDSATVRVERAQGGEKLRPGDECELLFEQQCLRNIDIKAVDAYLLFREHVSYSDGDHGRKHLHYDRFVQHLPGEPCSYHSGEMLRQRFNFRIPPTKMGIRNPHMEKQSVKVVTVWTIKIDLISTGGQKFLREYETDEIFDGFGHSPDLPHLFDLYLVGGGYFTPWRVLRTMTKLFPYLDRTQLGDRFWRRPSLLLEARPTSEVQSAKAQLEAAGAVVEVHPATDRPS